MRKLCACVCTTLRGLDTRQISSRRSEIDGRKEQAFAQRCIHDGWGRNQETEGEVLICEELETLPEGIPLYVYHIIYETQMEPELPSAKSLSERR